MALNPEEFRGKGVDDVFRGGPIRSNPFPRPGGRRKDLKDYDENAVGAAIRTGVTTPVDPTTLHSMQPSITAEGVRHYHEGRAGLFADGHQLANQHPVVYHRETEQGTTSILLSGTHRATSSLMKGEPLHAIEVRGGYGGPRR